MHLLLFPLRQFLYPLSASIDPYNRAFYTARLTLVFPDRRFGAEMASSESFSIFAGLRFSFKREVAGLNTDSGDEMDKEEICFLAGLPDGDSVREREARGERD